MTERPHFVAFTCTYQPSNSDEYVYQNTCKQPTKMSETRTVSPLRSRTFQKVYHTPDRTRFFDAPYTPL
jgi:hypothetical protein